jgi:hypothetical protein
MPERISLQHAYKLWLYSGFGLLGLHRRYLCKPRTARLWMYTLGVFGVGAALDLFFLPWLVKRMHMIDKIKELQAELEKTAVWREELARAQKYEEAAYNRDKELLLKKKIAGLKRRLRLHK